ncbi:PTS transporter subunit EIIC [Pseudobutyrivibrio sp.]|uniref:PTS transporter subunit EIIC n=1 Tax=Pseudobutyrivibrio sp. TaxID=2014367 RepID=UPI001D7AF9DA|nr:PTS transporter subunit EIIC [Pseudobutyrivibrio sp.]MBE5909930.1 PTS trehalose transporter subunit IIBC [Pseudobutyrivibrio sp.]
MDVKNVSRLLLEHLGGKENIISNEACMTRLRVGVKDFSKVSVDEIKKIDGVMGVVESDTLQIVFGPGTVTKVLDAFSELTGIPKGTVADDVNAVAKENKAAQKAKYDKPVQNFLKRIANIFVPLLPGIIAAGLINGLTNVINVTTGGALSGIWWYECIHTMGWALFAYLAIFVGYNAAREFGGSPILGGIAGAICISNAAMPLLATYNDAQIILPMTGAAYNPANGGLIAALIAGVFFAWLEKKIRKVMPNIIDTFISPLLVLIIGSLAVVIIIQPVGAVLTKGIYTVMNFVYGSLGVVGGYILSAGFLPLVAVGLHQALTPIHAMLNDPAGPTEGINYLLPILMMAGGGQVGAGLALYVKTKNAKLKRFIRDSIPVGILGIGEPLMYAVTLPLGKAFITACLGAGFGGIVASLFHIGTVSQGVSGLFGLLIVEPGHQFQYVIAMLCAYIGGFVVTWLFGVDEDRINEIYGE